MKAAQWPGGPVYLFDIEVFRWDWVVVLHRLDGGGERVFHNDAPGLAAFLAAHGQPPLLGGFNVKHYDRWILSAICSGGDNGAVKALSDFIIAGGRGWEHPAAGGGRDGFRVFDLRDDLPPSLSLKEIEGCLGMDIRESQVSFALDRPLTAAEAADTVGYCRHDVAATAALCRARADYLDAKLAVGALAGMEPAEALGLTNAGLTARFLGARRRDFDDETVYEPPDNLVIRRYPAALEFFSAVDPAYRRTLDLEIGGVVHRLAWGGLHGALERYGEDSTAARAVVHLDVASYYPTLMIRCGCMSRAAPDPAVFRRVYERRLAAKAEGDTATAAALKLVLNTAYGAMKNRYNPLYDPRNANAVCISGQLYLIDLIEKLEEVDGLRLIQSNTDGLILSVGRDRLPAMQAAVAGWEARTGFSMERGEVERIRQKDVNNYVLRTADGRVSAKGAYVSAYGGGGGFRQAAMPVVAEAVVKHLLDGVPVEDTIRGCNDAAQFQTIAKAGRSYDGVVWDVGGRDVPVQRVNRVFAALDGRNGTLYKLKTKENRRERMAGLPDHCLLDNEGTLPLHGLDREFYIRLARQRIEDYGQGKQRRKGTMAATKKPQGLGEKLAALRAAAGGGAPFAAALADAGLDIASTLTDYDYIAADGLVLVRLEVRLIDRATGEAETYAAGGAGAGADAVARAQADAMRCFLAGNFFAPPEREGGPPETPRAAAVPEMATDAQLEELARGIALLERSEADRDMAAALAALLEGGLTRAEAEDALAALAALLPQGEPQHQDEQTIRPAGRGAAKGAMG